MRQIPRLEQTSHVFAADPILLQQLSDEDRSRLNAFLDAQTLCQSVASLTDAMKTRDADVVLLLSRFDKGQLYVGREAFGIAELQAWLQESADASPDPAVVLMGCGVIADQDHGKRF